MIFLNKKFNKGFGLVEVIVGVSIISITLIGLISTYNLFLEAALKNTKKIQASYLLEEGLEAIRSIRDESWTTNISSLSSGVNYGLTYNGTKWILDTSPVLIDSVFYRVLNIEGVLRDSNSDISLFGTNDPNTKFFTVSVSWLEGRATTTKVISAYLSNIF